jgi:hypothetical protein
VAWCWVAGEGEVSQQLAADLSPDHAGEWLAAPQATPAVAAAGGAAAGAGGGLVVDHVTIYRWVQRFTPLVIDAARPL